MSHSRIPVSVLTVGDLRIALQGHPDDEPVHAQVVAQDHTTWNMHAHIAPVYEHGRGVVLTLSHPQLETLATALAACREAMK